MGVKARVEPVSCLLTKASVIIGASFSVFFSAGVLFVWMMKQVLMKPDEGSSSLISLNYKVYYKEKKDLVNT